MKKLVIISLALFLALPAVTFAGSATSRWDMTIGGFVKFDIGWADQGIGADSNTALRKTNTGRAAHNASTTTTAYPSQATSNNVNDEYGSFFMTGMETRLNFLVKGPDAWGAKTSAFTEFDFRGYSSGDRGGAMLRHAFIKFDWQKDSLLIGRSWPPFWDQPIPFVLGTNELAEAKNKRTEQITWSHKWGKNVLTQFGIANGDKSWGNTGVAGVGASSQSRSMLPQGTGHFKWSSDACGKIGSNMLTFGASGLYGYTKETWQRTVDNNGVAYPTNKKFDDANVKSYLANIYMFVPIIPEKNADKTNALAVSGGVSMFSNLLAEVTTVPPVTSGAYARFDGALEAAPTYMSGWGNLSYNITNAVQVNAIYGHTHVTNASIAWQRQDPNRVMSNDTYILSASYDVNPAVKLGVQFAHYFTKYANDSQTFAGIGGSNTGSANVARATAWYYF